MTQVTDAMVLAMIEAMHGPGFPWGWSVQRADERKADYRRVLELVEEKRGDDGGRLTIVSLASLDAAQAVFTAAGCYPGDYLVQKALAAAAAVGGAK